jgi:hypothetical protein
MADRIGNWQPKPGPAKAETAAPPNSPRRPGDPEGAIAEAMKKLPAHCTLPGDALEDAIERGDDKAVEECLVAIERNRAMDPEHAIAVDLDALLLLAFDIGRYETAELLLKHGASPNQRTMVYESLIGEACNCADLSVVRSLIKAGADVNALDAHGRTPLVDVCRRRSDRQLALMELLIAEGADQARFGHGIRSGRADEARAHHSQLRQA